MSTNDPTFPAPDGAPGARPDLSPDGHESLIADVFDPFPTRTPAPPAPAQVHATPIATPTARTENAPARAARPAQPRPVRKPKKVTGRFAVATTLMSLVLVTVLAVSFLGMTSGLPWLDDSGTDPIAAVDTPQPSIAAISDPGASPAETALGQVISTGLPALATWDISEVSTSVAAASFGFGCDPRDGLAPVAARSKSFARPDGTATVSVSVRAYPAGGGAVALDGMAAAATDCADAYLDYVPSTVDDLGVDREQIASDRVAALVWRRGDVLVSASVTANRRAGDPGAYADSFALLDEALAGALTDVCLDPAAGAEEAARSPYLDRSTYAGRFATETVERPDSKVKSAEKRSKFPVVPDPAPQVKVPTITDLPVVPSPAPTQGPNRLPAPAPSPTLPTAPAEPTLTAEVSYGVEDPEGPGCGWAFTAQTAPVFDSAAAQADYDKAVAKAQARLDADWRTWQKAKIGYYKAYDSYLKTARTYRAYARQVEEARTAWAAIETARANYYAAVAAWQVTVDVRDAFLADLAAAKTEYAADKAACKAAPTTPATSTATPTPTSPTTPGQTPTPTPTVDPTPEDPDLVCPPVRPTILDEPTPSVAPSPTPPAEAQLPGSGG